jgi:hypothetical protein
MKAKGLQNLKKRSATISWNLIGNRDIDSGVIALDNEGSDDVLTLSIKLCFVQA